MNFDLREALQKKHREVTTSHDRVTFYAWVSLSSFYHLFLSSNRSLILVLFTGNLLKNIYLSLPPNTFVLVDWPLFVSIYLDSPLFTSIYLNLNWISLFLSQFTMIYFYSPWFIYIYLHLLLFSLINRDLSWFTLIDLVVLQFIQGGSRVNF